MQTLLRFIIPKVSKLNNIYVTLGIIKRNRVLLFLKHGRAVLRNCDVLWVGVFTYKFLKTTWFCFNLDYKFILLFKD